MKWSVIICTHNRADDLAETLHAVAQLDYARDKHEILVVDNASQDDTKEVVSGMMAQLAEPEVFS